MLSDSPAGERLSAGSRLLVGAGFLLFAAGLYLFYIRYVPLVSGFQWALVPLLALVAAAAFFSDRAGSLLFIFLVPLVSSLPYFFGIDLDIPHSPTALVLFLFFFAGWLAGTAVRGTPIQVKGPISRPLLIFASMSLISAVVTFFRFSDLYPILTRSFLEFTTNTKGVTAGGAVMSVVLTSLHWLSGIALFFLLMKSLRGDGTRKASAVLILAVSLSVLFGFIQLLFRGDLGNSSISLHHGLVNGTYKDSLSFSAVVVMTLPLMLGFSLSVCGPIRMLTLTGALLSGGMLLFTGSKISLAAALFGVGLFIWWIRKPESGTSDRPASLRWPVAAGVLLVVTVILLLVSVSGRGDNRGTTISRFRFMMNQGVWTLMERWRGPLWRGALSMIGDYPLSGVGIGGYVIEVANFEREFFRYETPQSAENLPLQVGAELGLPAMGLLLWVLFLIARRAWSSRKRIGLEPNDRALILGAGAGLLGFILTLFFHTYINSYEVWYVFWLLAALLFATGAERPPSGRFPIVPAAAALLVFSLSLVWSASHSLSLEERTRRYDLDHGFGFHAVETSPDGDYRWTGANAGMTVLIEEPRLRFRLHASHPDIGRNPVRVRISLVRDSFRGRVVLDELVFRDSSWRIWSTDLEKYRGEKVILIWEVSRTWNPQRTLGVPDPRRLGVAVSRVL